MCRRGHAHLARQFLVAALGTLRNLVAADQKFEIATAFGAGVFVQWHIIQKVFPSVQEIVGKNENVAKKMGELSDSTSFLPYFSQQNNLSSNGSPEKQNLITSFHQRFNEVMRLIL